MILAFLILASAVYYGVRWKVNALAERDRLAKKCSDRKYAEHIQWLEAVQQRQTESVEAPQRRLPLSDDDLLIFKPQPPFIAMSTSTAR